ncbi:wings apart-like protein regulation of heterochromatin-domain-containing protein [Cryomyces antarcticus]
MTAIDPPQPRRRIATYGKAARRTQHGVNEDPNSLREEELPATTQKGQPRKAKASKTTSVTKATVQPKLPAHRATPHLSEFDVPSSSDEERPRSSPRKFRSALASATVKTSKPKLGTQRGTSLELEAVDQEDALPRKRRRPTPQSMTQGEHAGLERIGERSSKTQHAIANGVNINRTMRRTRSATPTESADNQHTPVKLPGLGGEAAGRPRRIAASEDAVTRSVRKANSALAPVQEVVQSPGPTTEPTMEASSSDTDLAAKIAVSATSDDRGLLPITPLKKAGPPAITRSGTTTPRQAELWDQLLAGDQVSATSSIPESQDTATLVRRSPGRRSLERTTIVRCASERPQTNYTRRVRLVDTLLSAAPSSEDDEDSDSADEERVNDTTQLGSRLSRKPTNETSQNSATSSALASQSLTAAETGLKVTYARTRSYLREETLESEMLFDMPLRASTPPKTVRSKTGLTASQSQPLSVFDSDMDDALGNNTTGIRSIHELRANGVSHSFTHEISSLLDDLEDGSASARSRRRSALLELATKLSDKLFVHRFVEQGFDQRLLASVADSVDPIVGFTMAAVHAFMLDADVSEHSIRSIYEHGGIVKLVALLDSNSDINKMAKERRCNMSKVALSTLGDFRNLLQNSSIWKTGKPSIVSPRNVALRGLELLVRGMRELRSTDELLDDIAIEKLLHIAQLPFVTPKMGVTPPDPAMNLESVLSILESCSLSRTTFQSLASWPVRSLGTFANLLPALLSSTGSRAAHAAMLGLRLSLNLTNNNAIACMALSTSAAIGSIVQSINAGILKLGTASEGDDEPSNSELLLLSLGTLINLAEFSDAARQAVLDAELAKLVRGFLGRQERVSMADSIEETHQNVVHGYLAVLLCNLCLNNQIRLKVASMLPSQSMELLITAVEEFIHHNKMVDSQALEAEDGSDVWTNFTERLQAVVDRLKAAES